jgi:hypothetical protein
LKHIEFIPSAERQEWKGSHSSTSIAFVLRFRSGCEKACANNKSETKDLFDGPLLLIKSQTNT